jgi:flavin reductase (DIM6/NTAB) family NADH-FMN oxidoreductase RutF
MTWQTGRPDASLASEFREVMSSVATPVSVVTTMGGGGQPFGTTVSAFASLSMTPPMVLVALDQGSDLLDQVRTSGVFGLNVLASDQSELALAFARKGGASKFRAVEWELHSGLPRLPGAVGWLACMVDRLVDGGDHVVALGHVRVAETAGGHPLIYHRRTFGTRQPLEVAG